MPAGETRSTISMLPKNEAANPCAYLLASEARTSGKSLSRAGFPFVSARETSQSRK